MVVWVPDWPVHCLVVDLPLGGAGAVVHSERVEVTSDAARRAGVRSGMSIREATYVCPDLVCLPRDPDREARAFGAVVDAFDSVAAGVECVRPGVARCRARGPARWHGSEEPAALALVKKPSALSVLLALPMVRSHPWRRRARDVLFLPKKANRSWGAYRYIAPCGPFLSR